MSSALRANCEIVIATTVGEAWSEWFDGFDVKPEGANSRLVGSVVDQAALHGILARLRDLAIPILDVHVSFDPQSGATGDGEIHPRAHDSAVTAPYRRNASNQEEGR